MMHLLKGGIIFAVPVMASAMLIGCAPAQSPRHIAPVTAVAPATDQMIMVDGVNVRVRMEGPEKAPPVILIHGFTFSLETWDAWAADLSRDHRVIRYDLAGHGLSSPDPQNRYGTEDRVRQLGLLMDALNIKHATIAGNSFGGLVAWNFAVQHPDRVDRLILVDSAAWSINGVTEKAVPVPPAMQAYLLNPTLAGVAASAALIYAHPERLPPQRLEQMRAMIARPGNGPALIAHLEQFTLPDPTAALRRVKAPTLILWGSEDKVIPVAHAGQIAALIPNSRSIIYNDVGHSPQEEAPAKSIADLREFLSKR